MHSRLAGLKIGFREEETIFQVVGIFSTVFGSLNNTIASVN